MKSSLKRLAKDQVALRRSLPPNYFFEDTEVGSSLPDDLTQLSICLTGPEGTPYAHGLWHIRLDIPLEYPQRPPTATFKTRIFHPNVAEETGAVCLETLKRDWDPKLTLKDILITISCLLIQPNADSALNQKAGALIQDDYEGFARQARLMTKVHAPIPMSLVEISNEARQRGEESESGSRQPSKDSQSNKELNPISMKENRSTKEHPTVRLDQDRPAKRSIEHLSSNSEVCDSHQDSEPRRRKSPKHQHHSEENVTSKDASFTNVGQNAHVVDPPSITAVQMPQKVVFKAQWSAKSNILRTRARIGIRRL